jgi:plasmid stabilization system protein ParE
LVLTQRGRAVADMQSIDAYEKQERERELLRENAEAMLSRLAEFPESGPAIPEFPWLLHREVIVRPYRLFYRVAGKTVWIVAVWHSAQLPVGPAN